MNGRRSEGSVRSLSRLSGGDDDRHDRPQPGPARGSAGQPAGRAGDGRARRRCVPPLRRALPAVHAVPGAEAAAERAGREPAGLPVRGARRKHARHGEGAHGGIRRARTSRRPGAGTGRDGRRPRPRPQVAVAGRREPGAHQSRRHQAAAQAVQRGARTSRASRSRSPSSTTTSGSIATSKANIGFALFGLGRTAEGKRFADEALAEYERTGATAEIASLLGEYGQYLERAGDYKTALAFFHREHRLHEEMAATAHQRSVLELQEKYESEKSRREIELLNRQNALNSAELENQGLRERVGWLFAAVFVISLVVIIVFYRKLRVNNGLLAQKNRELSVRSSRDPLTALYNRRYFQDFMRDAPARPERRRRGETGLAHPRAAADRHRPLQADQRPVRPRGRRRGPRRRGPPPARHAAGNRHDRALGRRGVPGLRAGDQRRQARRDRGAHHGGGRRGADRVPGQPHSRDGVDRLRADAAAPGGHHPALGARDRPRRHGAVHGQAPRAQLRLRHPPAAPERRRSDGADRARSAVRVGQRHGRDAPRARAECSAPTTAAATPGSPSPAWP